MTECGRVWSTWEAGWHTHLCEHPDGHDGPCRCHCGSQDSGYHPTPEQIEAEYGN